MRKKLALLLAAIMVIGMVPMTAFAATTNRVSKVVTGTDDTELTVANAPVLRMYEKDLETASGDPIAFELDLTNAEWALDRVAADYSDMITGMEGIVITELTAKNIVIEGTVTADGETNGIAVALVTDLTDEGEATVTINPLQSIITAGTYKFATVADGDATVTIEKKTDVSESGDTLKSIVITETTPGAFDETGKIKLKLSNDWSFTRLQISAYPNALNNAGVFNITTLQDEDAEIEYDFTPGGVADLRGDAAAIITITASVEYDDDEVEPGEICEMTVSGDNITKTTLEVATAVTYGVTWEAEDKALPVFYSGEMDEDKDTLEVTMEEVVADSWLENRKTKIAFPDGVRVLGVDIVETDNIANPQGTFNINDDGNELTFTGWTKAAANDEASITFQFQLSIAPNFTGDIVATLTGKGVDEDIDAVIGTVVAPVTVEATKTDAIIDYRHTPIGDITITEAEAGVLKKGTTFSLSLNGGLQFDDDPTVEVVSGDLKIEDVNVNNGAVVIEIASESAKEPAVIKLTNVELFMERNIPAGAYALRLSASSTIGNDPATGASGVWNGLSYPVTDAITDDCLFQNAIASNVNNDESPYFDVRNVTIYDDYVNVVTSGRDQGDNTFTTTLKVTIGATEMYANDKAIALDVPAYISNGYTMLPVRAVTEALSDSAIVRWDDATKTVTITFGDRVINMVVGSSVMVINGVEVPMQAQCEITDSRAFIPLRDMGYALGLNDSKINWDDATKTATLN